MAATPDKLGKYEIRGTLGRGAMGLVYDGWDPLILRRVAIKTVRLADVNDDEAREALERFRREAQAAGQLTHPNIVGVFDFGQTDDLAYIVMEYVAGGSLKDFLDRKEVLAPARVCELMAQVLSALAFSHARGIVHRDVKPANIMLSAEGTAKLADFGIARIESSSMTSAGVILGTPAYMAPEQFLGEPADARSDIYAAGATLFHLLTGTRPYDGNPTSIMQKVLNAVEAPAASERREGVPAAFDAVLRRAMAREQADRFQNATDFARALLAALTAPAAAAPADEAESTLVSSLLGGGDPDATSVVSRPAQVAPVAAAAPVAKPASPPAAAKSGGGLGGGAIAGIVAVVLLAGGAGAYFLTRPASSPPAPPATPTPAARTEPPPAAAPSPPPAPAIASPAEAARAIAAVLPQAGCALARVQGTADSVVVDGLVGAGAPEDRLRGLVREAARGAAVTFRLRDFTAPFCDALDAIRPAFDVAPLTVALPRGATALKEGQRLEPIVTGIDFPAFLRVDSVDPTAALFHLHPMVAGQGLRADPARLVPAGRSMTLGVGTNNFTVSPPFGPQLILAVAASQKLLAAPRANDEPLPAYLAALRQAIAEAEASGAKLAAGAMIVETTGK